MNDAAAAVRRGFAAVWTSATPPGRLLAGRVTGSRAYGTVRPESDWDWGGVYVTATTNLLGLEPPPETTSYNKGDGEDWTFHEVRKFLGTLSRGSINTLEALFVPADALVPGDPALAPFWEELVAHRREFLTETVLTQTLNYATSQLRRIRGEPVRASKTRPDKPVDRMKDAAHGLRLLYTARQIARGEEPTVRLEGDELATVRSCLSHHLDPKVVVETADALCREIVVGTRPWPVPVAWPTAFANDWLLRLRRFDLEHPPQAQTATGYSSLDLQLLRDAGGAPQEE